MEVDGSVERMEIFLGTYEGPGDLAKQILRMLQ